MLRLGLKLKLSPMDLKDDEHLKNIIESAPIGIAILDATTLKVQSLNTRFLEISGKPKEAILDKWYWEPFKEAQSDYEDALNGVITSGKPYYANEVKLMLIRHGREEWLYVTFVYMPVKNEASEITKVAVWVLENTTRIVEHQKVENAETAFQEQYTANEALTTVNEELTAANEALHITQENLQEASIQLNLAMEAGGLGSTEVIFATGEMQASPQFKHNFGRKAEESFSYADLYEAILPEYREEIRNSVQHAIATNTIYSAEYPIRWPDGSLHWISAFGKPRYDETGKATRIVGLTSDITERILAQKVIEESEARFRSLAEGSEVMISVNDTDGNVAYVNQAWLNLTGKTQEQMQAYGWGDFLHPDDQEQLLTDFRAGIASKVPFTVEFRMLNAKDEARHIYTKVNPRLLPDGSYAGTISSSIDITERVSIDQAIKKLSNEIAETNQRLNIALEAANFGTWHINSETRELIANDRLRELFGFHPGETITVAGCIAQITDDYRDQVDAAIEEAITKGGNYDLSYTVKGFHDQQIRWVRAVGNLKVDASGEFSAFTGVIMDITEQRQDEQRKNDFIAMVSHELKTPLTSLSAYVQMLQLVTQKQGDQKLNDMLEKSKAQVKKMNVLINGFLDMSRFQSGKIHLQKQEFLLNELLTEVVADVALVSGAHEISFVKCNPVIVYADRDKIGQVVTNLLSNAVKYSPKGKAITVHCTTEDQAVIVSVTDEGMGIKKADMERLFDRFYRVEGKHAETISGFGIGLYLSAEIMERHHGKIGVKSELGKGSTFYFNIPLTQAR